MINGGLVMMAGVRHCHGDERHKRHGLTGKTIRRSGGCKVLMILITMSRGVGSLGSLQESRESLSPHPLPPPSDRQLGGRRPARRLQREGESLTQPSQLWRSGQAAQPLTH